jgi:PAS domain S-box-containing protein
MWATGENAAGRWFNAAWHQFTGVPDDQLMAAGWLRRIHPDDREAVVTAHHRCHVEGVPFELEYRVAGGDGREHWVLAHGSPDHGGGCAAVAFVITDRHQREAEMAARLAQALEENNRVRSLQALTASLGAVTDPENVAKVILSQGVDALGAATGSLCLVAEDGETLEVTAQVGYPPQVGERWGRFPLSAATPVGDAVRTGEGVFVSAKEELHARYPIFGGLDMVADQAVAVLPLANPGADPLGAMVFGFERQRRFSSEERFLLQSLADQATTALSRTRSRAALENARAELAFLADASQRLAGSLDMEHTLATVAELAVPRLADRCGIYLLVDNRMQSRLWSPTGPEPASIPEAGWMGDRPSAASTVALGPVLRTRRSLMGPIADREVVAAVRSVERRDAPNRDGFGPAVVLPLRARGQLVGALVLVNRADHTMTDHDRALAEQLASRAGVAIDNAQLYAGQVSLAHRLQANLLPPSLPVVEGLDLAARYAPSGDGAEVGGDFYDCIRTSRNRLLLVVGDVKGKGVEAAGLTGMARHVIRTMASMEGRPRAILASLNDALFRQEADRAAGEPATFAMASGGAPLSWEERSDDSEPRFCTVLVVSLTRRQTGFHALIASAGHPLPLLRHPDGHVETVGQAGQLLGILPTIELPETSVTLPRGSLLLCYTDGVSECHEGEQFFDEEGIAVVLNRTGGGPASVAAAAIERAARACTPTGEVSDDMAILAVGVL